MIVIQCKFSAIIRQNNCTLSQPRGRGGTLNVTFDLTALEAMPDAKRALRMVNTTWLNPAKLRSLAASLSPARIEVHGMVDPTLLRWFLEAADWRTVTHFTGKGLVFDTLVLNIFNRLPLLTILDIEDNDLAVVKPSDDEHPQPFLHAAKIVQLYASKNNFAALPDNAVAGMGSLQRLELGANLLTTIHPTALTAATSLRHLLLSENRITSIAGAPFRFCPRLHTLDLSYNSITHVPSDAFQGLSLLSSLTLSFNPLRDLAADTFAGLTSAQTIELDGGLLLSIDKDQFRYNTRLTAITVAQHMITHVPDTLFHHTPALRSALLFHNDLTHVPPNFFSKCPELTTVRLDLNDLKALHPNTFDGNPKLNSLSLQGNDLTTLPSDLFKNNTELRQVHLDSNKLTSLPRTLVAEATQLTELTASQNQLTAFSLTHAEALRFLELSANPLQHMPDVSKMPTLLSLRINDHTLPEINIDPLLNLRFLQVVELDAAHRHEWRLTATISQLHDWVYSANITTLHLVGAQLPLSFLHELSTVGMRVTSLSLGWSGMDEAYAPSDVVCSLLAPIVQQLMLTRTRYRRLELCQHRIFSALLLPENTQLEVLVVVSPTDSALLASSPLLSRLYMGRTRVLDISATRIPFSGALCTAWGHQMLFAISMLHESFQRTGNMQQLLFTCLARVDVLDLSRNEVFNNPRLINDITDKPTVLSSHPFFIDGNSDPAPHRATIPTFRLDGTPVACALRVRGVTGRFAGVPSLQGVHSTSTIPVFQFSCTCLDQFRLEGGTCVPAALTSAQVAGIAVGSLLAGLALATGAYLLLRFYRRSKEYRIGLESENELQKRLIEERDEEVMALKAAWEIGYEELDFVRRIDAGSEGAFGEVWLGTWDGIQVAVKVLRKSRILLDEHTVEEFGNEVEFLQRTRHANVVRFFGAGTDPTSGAPFLVLEHVALGSLKTLLARTPDDLWRLMQSTAVQATGADSAAGRRERGGVGRGEEESGGGGGGKREWVQGEKGERGKRGKRGEGKGGEGEQGGEEDERRRDGEDETKGKPKCDQLTHGNNSENDDNDVNDDKAQRVWELKLRLMADIAEGMAFVHSLGHIHRDLKSGNVLVSSALRAKIADFGSIRQVLMNKQRLGAVGSHAFATAAGAGGVEEFEMGSGWSADSDASATLTAGVGTPLYMAPEVLEGSAYNSKADVFSFGVLLWEIVTQQRPDLVEQELGDNLRGPLFSALLRLLRAGKRLTLPRMYDTCRRGMIGLG